MSRDRLFTLLILTVCLYGSTSYVTLTAHNKKIAPWAIFSSPASPPPQGEEPIPNEVEVARGKSMEELLAGGGVMAGMMQARKRELGTNNDRDSYDDVTDVDRAQTGRGGVDDSFLSDELDESLLDQSIQNAVNNLIKDVEARDKFGKDGKKKLNPEQKFVQMYRQIKEEGQKGKDNSEVGKNTENVSLEQQQERAADMLESLFGGEQAKDPFDERKVMMKLKNMLDLEDFKELFIDPKIGDYL